MTYEESISRECDNDMRSWMNMLSASRKGNYPVGWKECCDEALSDPFWIKRLDFYEANGRIWQGEEMDGPL